MKYKLKAVSKHDDKAGYRRWRIELWQYHTKWLDSLQGWFDTEEEAKQRMREINQELIQEKLL